MSETAHSAHGRVCRGCLVSETVRFAHEKVCQGCLVGETARSATGESAKAVSYTHLLGVDLLEGVENALRQVLLDQSTVLW